MIEKLKGNHQQLVDLEMSQHLQALGKVFSHMILWVLFPINDKATSVELNPFLHFLPWYWLSGRSTGKL